MKPTLLPIIFGVTIGFLLNGMEIEREEKRLTRPELVRHLEQIQYRNGLVNNLTTQFVKYYTVSFDSHGEQKNDQDIDFVAEEIKTKIHSFIIATYIYANFDSSKDVNWSGNGGKCLTIPGYEETKHFAIHYQKEFDKIEFYLMFIKNLSSSLGQDGGLEDSGR